MHWGGQEYRTVLENVWLNGHGHEAWLGCHPESETWRLGGPLGARLAPFSFRKRWRMDVALRLLGFCWRRGVDIIHCHGSRDSGLAALAYGCGVPVVRSRHVSGRIRSPRSYTRFASHVIAAAEGIRDALVEGGVAAEGISVVGEGVDLEEFRPGLETAGLRAALGLTPDDAVVLNVGMLRRDKGQLTLLEAFARLRNEFPRLHVLVAGASAGDASVAGEIEERMGALGVGHRFRLLGYRSDVAALLNLATVVAVTSIGTEAQSRVVPQAFACRRAVVATRVGGLAELVHDEETGLLIPHSDPVALADAIRRLLRDAQQREALASAGYALAQRDLSFEGAMAKTLAVYQQLIGQEAAATA